MARTGDAGSAGDAPPIVARRSAGTRRAPPSAILPRHDNQLANIRMRRALVLAALAFAVSLSATDAAPQGAAATACQGAACDRTTPWKKLTQVSLIASDPESPVLEIYRAEFDPARGDAAINVDLRRGDGEVRGVVGMIGGRMLLTRGLKVESGRELEAFDLPMLNIQLAQILLGRALPAGPAAVRGEQRIDHRDTVAIDYGTAGARGRIEAPWHVTGRVAKVQTGAIHFNLTLEAPLPRSAKKGETLRMQLQGELSMLGREVFADEASLDGWTVYVVGPRAEKRDGRTTMVFGATPERAGRFGTVADVREYIGIREKAARGAKTK